MIESKAIFYKLMLWLVLTIKSSAYILFSKIWKSFDCMNKWGFDYQFKRKFIEGVILISMENWNVKVEIYRKFLSAWWFWFVKRIFEDKSFKDMKENLFDRRNIVINRFFIRRTKRTNENFLDSLFE